MIAGERTGTAHARPALEAVGLSKQFGAVSAVSDLSFTVPAGSITALLGPPGAGKSTTLRMLLGLVAPTAGTATVTGVPFAALPRPAATVGAVLDTLGLHPRRTAFGHLQVYAAAAGVPDARAHEVLALVGLEPAGRLQAGTFTLDMLQRLALAGALLGNPRILVLDEPATGLAPGGAAWLREFLRAFAADGRTVLLASHRLGAVEQTADRLVVIGDGRLVHRCDTDELRRSHTGRVLVASENPARLALALGAEGIADARMLPDGRLAVGGTTEAEVAGIAAAAQVRTTGFVTEHVDLERVFEAMTAPQYPAEPRHPTGQQYPTEPQGSRR
ncbi:ABC transporter ATP-binding protein [Rhodococcus kronopolitis]|uniref:ABC transporter ATP-binding protein n=1 Tax=Rhodococcus kronopolitis TaxID=1460226 RepID=A0ABV9FWR5_9NOCA